MCNDVQYITWKGGDKLVNENAYHISDVGKMLGFTRQHTWKLVKNGIIKSQKNENGIYKITQQEYERLRKAYCKDIDTYELTEVATMLSVSKRGLLQKAIEGKIVAYKLPTIYGQKPRYVMPIEEFARLKALKRQAKKTVKITDMIK